MNTYEVKTISDFFKIVEKITNDFDGNLGWWRGQSCTDWDLIPSVYRDGFEKKERNMAQRFRLQARIRHDNCPKKEEPHSWLFLMQHYGLPTRLLDWSETPLIALFFTVEDHRFYNEDGALWFFNPTQLNYKMVQQKVIFMPDNQECMPLFHLAFAGTEQLTAALRAKGLTDTEILTVTKALNKILAVAPEQIDIRHLIQKSAFTVHGTSEGLNRREDCEDILVKIIVPKDSKKSIHNMLYVSGISRSYLFPDLTNLAKELSESMFTD